MATDLNLSSSDYSLVLSIFFVVSPTPCLSLQPILILINQSYLVFEVPSNMLLARSKPAIFLPSLMVTWGAVSIIVAAIHNLAGMVAFRFALGIIEAGFFP